MSATATPPDVQTDIQTRAIDTIRCLAMDAVQTANSGHPGTPMALAPVAYEIWQNAMSYDPADPTWPGRDRFVLSCGHASMLLYSMIHLTGVHAVQDGKPVDRPSLRLEDLKKFRQLDSPCAGHPEYGFAAGIETTTGPLGAGVSNSVGMAMAEKWLAATYNTDSHTLFNYDTYAICSDGDMMEGVACEAASIAGHLKLDNLCWFYDDNHITIEGDTDLAFTEDMGTKFKGLGWNVIHVDDANDTDTLASAIAKFKTNKDGPTLVIIKSIIAWGAPNKQNTHGAHGSPLGWDEVELAKKAYGFPAEEKFHIPGGVMEHFAGGIGKRGAQAHAAWQDVWSKYQADHPDKAAELSAMFAGELPKGWDAEIPVFEASEKGDATRNSSGKVLNAIAKNLPYMIGGSADLAPSTKTDLKFAGSFEPTNYAGRNLHFGIREHGMAGATNGLCLSGLRGYCSTFFVFTDYMRGAMRLSSIMHLPTLYILTHDSIGVGEDGPTHQPIEHLAACRAIPGLHVFRPGDANEVAECYRAAMLISDHPAAFVLSRQNMPTLDRTKVADAKGCHQGGYILIDCDGTPDAILMGTGSELHLCVTAAETLSGQGKKVRVVSMPCLDLFAEQDQAYQDSVLPPEVTNRVAVEAGIRMCWDRWIGTRGSFVGMDNFGASGPAEEVYEHFKISADSLVAAASR